MKSTGPMRAALALLLAGPALAAHAAQDGRWIHGSWVNVRATAAADGPVVDHLTTNTPVVLRAGSGTSCEIGWNKDGREGHGFVACKLLGDRPLTFADIGAPRLPDGQPNPHHAPLRAFWMAPSMKNLFAAGDYFADTLLSPQQRALENGTTEKPSATAPRLVRYPVPEFEAMKAVLAKGVVAPGADPWAHSCGDQPAGNDLNWRWSAARCRLPGMALRLPAVKPSLFKRSDRLLPGTATTEDFSATFKIVERGRTVGAPVWDTVHTNETPRYTGAWDIGQYELRLDKPVVEHVVGRTGLVGAYRWTPQERITPNDIPAGCASEFSEERRGKTLLPGYPAIKDALLWFHAPQALPYKTARITARVVGGARPVKDESVQIRRVVVYDIDLDHDGVPDFEQWETWGTGELFGTDPVVVRWELYVNVEGRWYPFGWNYNAECT